MPMPPDPSRPRRRLLRGLTAAVALAGWGAAAWADTLIVRYPRPESAQDTRRDYALRVLALALSYSTQEVKLVPSDHTMQQGRALVELAAGRYVDVVNSMTSREREDQLYPIRIPIDKGLLGYRLALVRATDRDRFAEVTTLPGLAAARFAQGHDWPDLTILRANGLTTLGVSSYDALFTMLAAGRFDLFPRSVAEIWAEQQQHQGQGLVVANGIAFHYPTAEYFFVSRSNPHLASLIERGLEAAVADGSLDRLFREHFADLLKSAQLSSRHIIHLSNPLLPARTPLARAELWYAP